MLHACWRPVVTLAYALQYKLFGESPFGYHLVHEALHLGCSLLAWGFVRRRVAGALLALGVFSKETAVVAPLLLFADAVLLQRSPAHRRAVGVASVLDDDGARRAQGPGEKRAG